MFDCRGTCKCSYIHVYIYVCVYDLYNIHIVYTKYPPRKKKEHINLSTFQKNLFTIWVAIFLGAAIDIWYIYNTYHWECKGMWRISQPATVCVPMVFLWFSFGLLLFSYGFLGVSHGFLGGSYGFLGVSYGFLGGSYGFVGVPIVFVWFSYGFLSYGFLNVSYGFPMVF
jgi:hypothetical protein